MTTFQQAFRRYTLDRLVGCEFIREGTDGQAERAIASGFCIVVDDALVWVTAGHVIRKFHEWKAKNELHSAKLLKVVDESITVGVVLDFTKSPALFYGHDDYDIGFVILDIDVATHLHKAKLKPFDDQEIGCGEICTADRIALIGFPSSSVNVSRSVLERIPDGNGELEITEEKTESLGVKAISLGQPKVHLARPHLLRLRPENDELSVSGMSGGPIVAITPEGTGLRVFAIQSKEKPLHRSGKTYCRWITAVNAEFCVNGIREKVIEILAEK